MPVAALTVLAHRELVVGLRRYVLDVDRPSVHDRPTATGPRTIGNCCSMAVLLGATVRRCATRAEGVTIDTEDDDVRSLAKPRGVVGHGVEDGLEVGRRARDHPQDLARRRLLLQRLGHLRMGLRERPVLLLQLREQPDVLDGDDRLVGEGLEQRDLLSREGPASAREMTIRPDRLALVQHGHGQHGPEGALPPRRGRYSGIRTSALTMSSMWTSRSDHARPSRSRGPGMAPPTGVDAAGIQLMLTRPVHPACRRTGTTEHRWRRTAGRRSRRRSSRTPAGGRSASWRSPAGSRPWRSAARAPQLSSGPST